MDATRPEIEFHGFSEPDAVVTLESFLHHAFDTDAHVPRILTLHTIMMRTEMYT
jgi:hypothetical protein